MRLAFDLNVTLVQSNHHYLTFNIVSSSLTFKFSQYALTRAGFRRAPALSSVECWLLFFTDIKRHLGILRENLFGSFPNLTRTALVDFLLQLRAKVWTLGRCCWCELPSSHCVDPPSG
jgi:hypothetical protein